MSVSAMEIRGSGTLISEPWPRVDSHAQEVCDELLASVSQHALRVKLHAFDCVALVAQTHDQVVFIPPSRR